MSIFFTCSASCVEISLSPSKSKLFKTYFLKLLSVNLSMFDANAVVVKFNVKTIVNDNNMLINVIFYVLCS